MLFSIRFLILIVKFFDTFSGIGGFALPLTELGHECIGFSEIDKYASAIYARHFPSHHPYGDITAIDAAALPDFGLLTGGFPCQAFSVIGRRLGFQETRGTLFFDLCRIVQVKQPCFLLFENVKGLLSHDGGRTFGTILASLDELGYDAQWQVCNSQHFGVPHLRERVYVLANRRDVGMPAVFPIVPAEACVVSGCELLEGEGQSWPADAGAEKLTPVECERLQAFPDDWTAGISDTQRYRCCGNAVTVNVVREIVKRLK